MRTGTRRLPPSRHSCLLPSVPHATCHSAPPPSCHSAPSPSLSFRAPSSLSFRAPLFLSFRGASEESRRPPPGPRFLACGVRGEGRRSGWGRRQGEGRESMCGGVRPRPAGVLMRRLDRRAVLKGAATAGALSLVGAGVKRQVAAPEGG